VRSAPRRTFVAPLDLTPRFTVVRMTPRPGYSGDTAPFAAEREYEDLAAVVAAAGTEPPFVFGHSSGAAIALRAAAAGLPVAGIAAYEAPFANDDTPLPAADPADRIRQLVALWPQPRGRHFLDDGRRPPAGTGAGAAGRRPVGDGPGPLARTLPTTSPSPRAGCP